MIPVDGHRRYPVRRKEAAPIDPSVTHGVVVVVERGGRYLMVRRASGVVAPGAWCFVGGALEPGESEEQAVIREFHEEVGGRVRPLARVWEYVRPDGKLRLYWWRAELLDPPAADLRPNPAEVAELRWCTPGEMQQLPDLLESNRQFLAVLRRRAPNTGLDGGPDHCHNCNPG
jgi:8-oxo-dGTP pyrophosphatase MutT (NUDIX family)